jgi:hypothetical protein
MKLFCLKTTIALISVIILSGTLSAKVDSDGFGYNRTINIGMITDRNSDGYFPTIGVSKQYPFHDFMIGMDYNLSIFSQNEFSNFNEMTLSPKLSLVAFGNNKRKYYFAFYVNSGVSIVTINRNSSFGYSGGVGIDLRYLNYGLDLGYVSTINNFLSYEGVKINLKYWLN